MLRIRRDDFGAHMVVLMLQGSIVAEWAELLERECKELIRSGFNVVLDFADVVFIGRSGREALGRLDQAGVRIIRCPSLLAAMLQQERIVARRKSDEEADE